MYRYKKNNRDISKFYGVYEAFFKEDKIMNTKLDIKRH